MYSAGILFRCVKENTTYYLLGKDKMEQWSDFGGGSSKFDKTVIDTAAREAFEETCRIFDKEGLKDLCRESDFFQGKTYKGNPYYMFICDIDHDEKLLKKFFLNVNRENRPCFKEKKEIKWFEEEQLEHIKLRQVFKDTFDSFKNIVSV